jgi:hypothetical protein
MQGPGPPGWMLEARLTTLRCKKLLLRNPKKWKPGCSNLIRNLIEPFNEVYGLKGLFCQ